MGGANIHHRDQEIGNKNQETGNRKQETGNRKQETERGNRNSRARGGIVSYLSTTAVISRPGVTACAVVARSETITMEMSQHNGDIAMQS